MENFTPQKIDIGKINGGQRYNVGDAISPEAINAPIEAAAFAQFISEKNGFNSKWNFEGNLDDLKGLNYIVSVFNGKVLNSPTENDGQVLIHTSKSDTDEYTSVQIFYSLDGVGLYYRYYIDKWSDWFRFDVKLENKTGISKNATISQKTITECIAYYNIKDCFELGTVYADLSNRVYYENSPNTIRLQKGISIHLNAGDIIKSDETTEFRLVRTDEGYVGMQSYLSAFTVVESGNYTLAMRYKDLSVIGDVDVLSESLFISNSKSQISKHLKEMDERMASLSAELSANSYRIVTTDDQFEVGTAYQNGSNISYDDYAKDCVRIKRGTTIYIPSNSRIVTNGLEVRVVYAETGQVATVTNYTADPVDVAVGGAYVLVFRYADRREITSIDDVLELFTIENGSNPLVVRLAKLERDFDEVKVDNSAKSVFSIMSYNVGRWYNGSGQKVPDADFEKFLALQESIIDRYSPDILCVQEYSDDIASGKSTLEYLIKSRYHFHPTALGTTSYDGKAICTNRSLSDATNILFTNKEAALNRNYEKAYVYMNGRRVCVISAHLSQGQTECASNIQQILADIQSETYVIICADTNVDPSDPTSAKYQATLKQFVDAGYVLANNGDLKTHHATQSAIDNIIVTSNITIKSTIVDTQKLEFLALSDVDHLPLISYIELY